MPTKYKLSREMEEKIINWAVENGLVKAEEQVEEKPRVLIDKYALQKLFWNAKFREIKQPRVMPKLVVRCNHANKNWQVMLAGKPNPKMHFKDALVLENVKFLHQAGTELVKVDLGCCVIEDEEVKKVAPQTAKVMEILEFVKTDEVDPIYLETSYYMAPDEAGEKPYALLFDALKKTGLFKEIKLYDSIADITREVKLGRIKAGFGDAPIIAYQISQNADLGVRIRG